MNPKLSAPFPWFGGKSIVSEVVWRAFGEVGTYVEPFAGSLAVLLRRPGEGPFTETVNDRDGFIANFWRALAAAPDEVAQAADWPVNEADLHARHGWLVRQREELTERLMGDPDFYDARIAGWWVWGLSCWIGSGWCSGRGPWRQEGGRLIYDPKGHGVEKKRPAAGKGGRGVHGHEISKKVPLLANSGAGVHAKGIKRQRPSARPERSGQGVHSGVYKQKPMTFGQGFGNGVHRSLDRHSGQGLGKGVFRDLYDWLGALATRLRRVRVVCGDWQRVMGKSVIHGNGVSAVFLDPPYVGVGDELYAHDAQGVAKGVHDWVLENAKHPKLRIALCGYEGEFKPPGGWQTYAWRSRGGYGQKTDNSARERIWFSPTCRDIELQKSLF